MPNLEDIVCVIYSEGVCMLNVVVAEPLKRRSLIEYSSDEDELDAELDATSHEDSESKTEAVSNRLCGGKGPIWF